MVPATTPPSCVGAITAPSNTLSSASRQTQTRHCPVPPRLLPCSLLGSHGPCGAAQQSSGSSGFARDRCPRARPVGQALPRGLTQLPERLCCWVPVAASSCTRAAEGTRRDRNGLVGVGGLSRLLGQHICKRGLQAAVQAAQLLGKTDVTVQCSVPFTKRVHVFLGLPDTGVLPHL